jgi:hypothetical protein
MLGFGDQNFGDDHFSDNKPITKPNGPPLTESETAGKPTDTTRNNEAH